MQLEPGTVIAGRYRLERPLAAGGMGAVWVARHLSLHTEVAIKFMANESASSSAARGRFEREARASAQLKHPNIVTVQDYGIEGETPYLVMELLRGESLDDRLNRKGRISIDVLAPILQQMARGLRKAHEAGIVHRDLKPGNVFLARDDDDEEVVKILDFGIAKEIDVSLDEHTKTSELMGSPHYMSPEQLRSSKKTDVRSDLWSVGVMLYKALTGKIPFPGDTLAEVMVQVFSAKLAPPSTIAKNLPPTTDDFFKRALARNPDDRFQTIRELSDAFTAIATGKPLPTSTTGPQVVPNVPSSAQGLPAPPIAPALGPPAPAFGPPPPASPLATPVPISASPTAPSAPSSSPGLPAPAFDPNRASRPFSTTGASLPFVSPPQLSMPDAAASGLSPSPSLASQASAQPPAAAPGFTTAPTEAFPSARSSFDSLPTTPDGRLGQTGEGMRSPLAPEAPTPSNAPFQAPPIGAAPPASLNKRLPLPLPVLVFGAAAGLLLLMLVLVLVFRSGSSTEEGAVPAASASSAHGTEGAGPMATAGGTALTPEEIAAAVPDESPVEVTGDDPAAAASSKQAKPPGWKPIPKGHARLLVMAKGGGSCKVTLNGAYLGTTPVDMVVEAGRARIFCRMPTGSTRSKELRLPEYKVTKVEFEVKM